MISKRAGGPNSERQTTAQYHRQSEQRTTAFSAKLRSLPLNPSIDCPDPISHHVCGTLELLRHAGYFPQPSPIPHQSQYHTFSRPTAHYGGRCSTTSAILYLWPFSPTSPPGHPRFGKALLELHLFDRVCTAGCVSKGQRMQGRE